MSYLQTHPFAVEAFFESSLVLTYALPITELQHLIPPCLQLDTFNNEFAFVAVAMVQTKDLRPKGFPKFMGNDFFLAGYRIFVKYITNSGKRYRGLYILKSETDKPKMTRRGNIFTHYKYNTTDIQLGKTATNRTVFSDQSKLDIEVNIKTESPTLPIDSPFKDWKEARRYAGPLPFTFSYNPANKEVTIIEGVRENWTPRPVEVIKAKVGFMQQMEFKNRLLANAFIIENIPYYWKKGRTEIWKG